LTATLNGARVLESIAGLLGTTYDEFSALALAAAPGADGLVLVPYFEGERTPNRPDATATLYGLTLASTGREQLARAAVEGLLCGLADGLAAIEAVGVAPLRVLLIGGGARSEAVRRIAPTVLGLPLTVPEPGEYVADGAARQAAWVLSGAEDPPSWAVGPTLLIEGEAVPALRSRYADARDRGSIRPPWSQ
jgi:xylulokinase